VLLAFAFLAFLAFGVLSKVFESIGEYMITDEELLQRIENIIREYKGDISYLNEAIGIVVVGRLIGWEHQRLVSSRPAWTFTTKLFGDPKAPDLMPKRGRYSYKSFALELSDKIGGYLDILKGKKSLPMKDRRILKTG
jgi:hypothetical protein